MADPGKETSLLRSPYFWAAVGAAIAIPAYRAIVGPATPALPVLGHIPNTELIDQDGRPFETGALHRTPWIANFFCTSCPSVCPPMMAELARIQGRLSREELPVRIVSITVDPATDRPEVLKAYGERLGADFDRWSLVTGEPEVIAALAQNGFKSHVATEGPASAPGSPDVVAGHREHTARLMIVDGLGAVRGSFEVTPRGSDELLRRARILVSARR